jgi:hypothetical protein
MLGMILRTDLSVVHQMSARSAARRHWTLPLPTPAYCLAIHTTHTNNGRQNRRIKYVAALSASSYGPINEEDGWLNSSLAARRVLRRLEWPKRELEYVMGLLTPYLLRCNTCGFIVQRAVLNSGVRLLLEAENLSSIKRSTTYCAHLTIQQQNLDMHYLLEWQASKGRMYRGF